jgi:hypothetical protein
LESESEWSQHRKLIEIAPGRDIRKCIPPGFAYFSVEFVTTDPVPTTTAEHTTAGSGYAHVIEDDREFPRNFGREIIGGMLNLDPEDYLRPKDQPPHVLQQNVKNFLKNWVSKVMRA